MTVRQAEATSLALGRAAEELSLGRGEFELAVQLGQVRALSDVRGGPPRFDRQEIDRLRSRQGFPEALREQLRTVGTADGADLASISQGRFLRLARAGHLTPVRFYVNRYHAVVWLYLAEEVRDFARDHPALLTGATPPQARAAPAAGEDRRPRNWRGRRLGDLLRLSGDPRQRAAAIAAVLDPVTIAEVVPDPYERSYLRVLRPDLAPARPKSPAGREIVERLLQADHPDEILWHRTTLADGLREAREHAEAPRPAPGHRPWASASDPARRHPPGRRPGSTTPAPAARASTAPTAGRLGPARMFGPFSLSGPSGPSGSSRRGARGLLGRLLRRPAARA
ncbi:DUF6397 family protein [Streptomyces xantholiticus]|uniref:DUF6397 family protein n=1 Tax=Streptomyces xantholiticus TaxID=68285 RepID=UPI00167AF782|nr:DUF6397 family protein [Streptomyces xantholiticus]GGW52871.1 hypothetical protein GCM10010381_43020 [Streptomyces xantholiticus]